MSLEQVGILAGLIAGVGVPSLACLWSISSKLARMVAIMENHEKRLDRLEAAE